MNIYMQQLSFLSLRKKGKRKIYLKLGLAFYDYYLNDRI